MDNARLAKNELGHWQWERAESTRSNTRQLMEEQRRAVARCNQRLLICERKGWVAGGGMKLMPGGAYSNTR